VNNFSPRFFFGSQRRISSPKVFLARNEEYLHREFLFSPRIFFTLGKELFAESPREGSRLRFLLMANALFPVVQHPPQAPPLPMAASSGLSSMQLIGGPGRYTRAGMADTGEKNNSFLA
jgi:hypothetical protein